MNPIKAVIMPQWAMRICSLIVWLVKSLAVFLLFACPIYLLMGMETGTCINWFFDVLGRYFLLMAVNFFATYYLIWANGSQNDIQLPEIISSASRNRNSFYMTLIGSQMLMILALTNRCASLVGFGIFGITLIVFIFVDLFSYFLIERATWGKTGTD
ncbi:unnamed protein product [Orchesella dallaii]|uniref:Uncharacterized protein n=1 Tax=Orchesella dallaii TaxID=48710 RepID=A0ABP1R1U5_9HEXA